ncbi:MAG: glycosyltransferase family 4 protein [Chloroflexi bacterium]|nr:glycosyltransferase family 4 protein [Chloroflexota bacterium]
MRICYILLSPTFGMHQYTADLANRAADAGHEVHLVTTKRVPRDRYAPQVIIHTPVLTTNTGLSREGLNGRGLTAVHRTVRHIHPDLVHFTGPHLWNTLLARALTDQNIPTIHTLHDLDPHSGTSYARYGFLLKFWNWLTIRAVDHVLVHNRSYRNRLLDWGVPWSRITFTPLLHLFLSHTHLTALSHQADAVRYEPWALFFGRLERYKGIDDLLTACEMMENISPNGPKVVLAGPGNISNLWAGPLPEQLEVRNRLIDDEEAIDLFRRCGLVVLPYTDATQSALISAAYYFHKPVLVTRVGALPEYVEDRVTGQIVEPRHPAMLARSLEEMLRDPDRLKAMGEAGRAWYDTRRIVETRMLFQMYDFVATTNIHHTPSSFTVAPGAYRTHAS